MKPRVQAQCVIYTGPDAKYQGKEICFNYNEDSLTIVDVSDKTDMKVCQQFWCPGVSAVLDSECVSSFGVHTPDACWQEMMNHALRIVTLAIINILISVSTVLKYHFWRHCWMVSL